MRADKRGTGGFQDEDSDEMALENVFIDVIGQVLANKMSKSDPEYKNFKEAYDRLIPYFQDRFQYIADELIFDVFQEMNDRQPEFINVLSRNMLDVCELVRFFSKCFNKANPVTTVTANTKGEDDQTTRSSGRNIFNLMVETLS